MLKRNYLKIYLILILTLTCFMGLFYYSCGDVLYERETRNPIREFWSTNELGKITRNDTVEQIFSIEMDYVDTIGIMFSNYGQSSDNHVFVRIENQNTGSCLLNKTVPTAELGVNTYQYFGIENNTEKLRYSTLKITVTSDAPEESAPTVLFETVKMPLKNAVLTKNGSEIDGNMSIAVYGRDEVWTGPNYLKIVGGVLVLVSIVYAILALIDSKTKHRIYFFTIFDVIKQYGFLIQQLVSREFKTRYKRSVLGVCWSLLNPLLMMTVQYIVFSQLFKNDLENYPVYLLTGCVVFNFFTEAVSLSMVSIIGNAALITKVYMPKYIYPITKVLSSCINLFMSFIPLLLAVLITQEEFTKAYLMVPYIILCVIAFSIGFGMMMASAMTFFRDMQFLWGIISMAWTYLTPLFYPVSIIPEEFRDLYNQNPMVHFVGAMREIVLNARAPEPREFMYCTFWAVVMVAVGGLIFKKSQDKFVFYI